jgi:hypothetical protein
MGSDSSASRKLHVHRISSAALGLSPKRRHSYEAKTFWYSAEAAVTPTVPPVPLSRSAIRQSLWYQGRATFPICRRRYDNLYGMVYCSNIRQQGNDQHGTVAITHEKERYASRPHGAIFAPEGLRK